MRWGIEAGFRDIKDMRFGMGLSSMHVSRPDRRDRLLLISALAIAVLSLLGAAGERIGYDRWLKANTVKRRTHSLFRQGLMLYHHLPNWPGDWSLPARLMLQNEGMHEPRPSTFERPSRNGAGPAVGRLARTFQRPVPCPPLRPLEQQPCR